jgi:hypothetical protein
VPDNNVFNSKVMRIFCKTKLVSIVVDRSVFFQMYLSQIKLVFLWFLSFSILLEFSHSILIALYHFEINTFSNTVIASRIDHCDPFSTKDAICGFTGPALDSLFIGVHGNEIMLMYPQSHKQSNVIAS